MRAINNKICVVQLVAGGFIAAVYLMVRNLFQPWNSWLEGSDGALYSGIARNYMRYGAWALSLGQARNYELVSDLKALYYYQHHPPLLPILVGVSFGLLGESEGAARLVPILFTIGSAVGIYLVSDHLFGRAHAIASLIVFVTLPAVLFFARKPGHEPLSQFFIIVSFWYYLQLLRNYNQRAILGLYLSVFLGLMTAWPVYIWCGLLALHCRLFGADSRKHKIVFLGLPVMAVLAFCLLQIQSEIVTPGAFFDLIHQARIYAGLYSLHGYLATSPSYPEASSALNLYEFLPQILARLDLLFAYPVLLFAGLGVWKTLRIKGLAFPSYLPLAVAVLYAIIFYRSAVIHYWHIYYFAAPVALFAPIGVSYLLAGRHPSDTTIEESPFNSPAVNMFLVFLLIVGMAPRLLSLHQMQIKIFPDQLSQPASFSRDLGELVKSLSNNDDLVVIHLPQVDDMIRETVSYYAARRIVWGVKDIADTGSAVRDIHGVAKIHYAIVSVNPKAQETDELESELRSIGLVSKVQLDGYRIYWATAQSATVNP